MHTFTTFVVTAAMASSALAAPTANKRHINLNSFTVPHKHFKDYSDRNGTAALIRAYNKFSWPQVVLSPGESDDGGSFSWFPFNVPASGSSDVSDSSEGSDGQGWSWSTAYSTTWGSSPTSTPTSSAVYYATGTTETASATAISSAENAAASGSSSGVPGDFDGDGDGDVTGDTSATAAEGNSEFLSPITIGGQSFNLVSTLWSPTAIEID